MKMTDEEYFAHPGVSNSKLSLVNPEQGGFYEKYLNGFNEKDNFVKYLRNGTYIHRGILEPDIYIVQEAIEPGGKLAPFIRKIKSLRKEGYSLYDSIEEASSSVNYGENWSIETKLNKAISHLNYYKCLDKEGILMTPDMYETVTKCINSIKSNPVCYDLIYPTGNVEVYNEDSLFRTVDIELSKEIVTLDLKVRIDNWSINYDTRVITLNDIKTTSKPLELFVGYNQKYPVKKFIPGSFYTYRYYRQMPFYFDTLLEHVQKEYKLTGDWSLNVNMIVVETIWPYRSGVFHVSETPLKYGREEYQTLLENIAKGQVGIPEQSEFFI